MYVCILCMILWLCNCFFLISQFSVFLSLGLFFRHSHKHPQNHDNIFKGTLHQSHVWITMDLCSSGLSHLFGLWFGHGASYNLGPEDHGTDGASSTPPCHWASRYVIEVSFCCRCLLVWAWVLHWCGLKQNDFDEFRWYRIILIDQHCSPNTLRANFLLLELM